MREVRFTSDNALVATTSGKLRGLMDARDTNVPAYLNSLNTIAGDLITAVNGLHTTGYGLDGVTGRAFFAGTDATSIAVDAAIAADPRRVGAADAAGQQSNNTIALAIAQLRHTMSPTPESAYGALITTLGADARGSKTLADNQSLLTQLLDRRRQEVSGVSLDEETVNLLRFQRAYEAAARLITANDQMLDQLINRTGVVGR
jgi:flagellar hook-associated protein 1 FlgK